MSNIAKAAVKHAVLDVKTLQLSWSKIWAWVASGCGSIVLLQDQLTQAGIAIPPNMLPYFKVAGIVAGLIAALRLRDSVR